MTKFAAYLTQYRAEARNPTALRCVGGCCRRKPREEFRETPWHGRAAACKSCEGATWLTSHYEELRWKLGQEREKTRMLRSYIQRLRFRKRLTEDRTWRHHNPATSP